MSHVEAELPLPKLPLREAISLSYAWFFQKFTDILRISWLWIVICTVFAGLLSWIQAAWLPSLLADDQPTGASELEQPLSRALVDSGVDILLAIATVSIAVAWHRRIILDERPRLSGANLLTRPTWRYLGILILFGLVTAIPVLTMLIVVSPTSTAVLPAAVIMLVWYVVAIAVFLRLSPLLPACAIGDQTVTFRETWRRTQGNVLRLFGGLLACVLPMTILVQIVMAVVMTALWSPNSALANAAEIPLGVGLTLMAAGTFAGYLLTIPIGVGFLSHCYRHFFRGEL